MAKSQLDFNLRKFNPSCSLNITIHMTRELKVRKFLAVQLIRLAAWILGMSSDIKVEQLEANETD